MSVLPTLRRAMGRSTPHREAGGDRAQAAVAAIFHAHGDDARLLFIERARFDGDPWSGDLAFPGGRAEADDTDLHHTAERETHEEIGFSLAGAERLGRLDDLAAHVLPMTISACVYVIDELPEPVLSAEVVDLFWMDVGQLLDPQRQCKHILQRNGEELVFPALDLCGPGHPLLWGVTYRFVSDLMRQLGHCLPGDTP